MLQRRNSIFSTDKKRELKVTRGGIPPRKRGEGPFFFAWHRTGGAKHTLQKTIY